jgi:hypothetical protein
MNEMFPLNTGITELRSLIKLAKENGNSIELSKVAEETKKGIDVLLPLVDACRMLGLCTVNEGAIQLTEYGINLTTGNMRNELSRQLGKIEPFKHVLEIVGLQRRISTGRLAELLSGAGITLYTEKAVDAELLKTLLLKWAVRLRMLSYDVRNDAWTIPR